jgi:hypothetical protein
LIYADEGIIWLCNAFWDYLVFGGIYMDLYLSEAMIIAANVLESGTGQGGE